MVQEVTDENIVEMLCTPPQPVQQFSEDEEEEREKMTWKEEQASLETFIRFVEQSAHYNSSEVMSFHIAYNNFLKKKANSCKQADIRELFARASKRSAPAAISSPDEPSPMEDDSSPKASCSGVSRALYLSDSEDSD